MNGISSAPNSKREGRADLRMGLPSIMQAMQPDRFANQVQSPLEDLKKSPGGELAQTLLHPGYDLAIVLQNDDEDL